MKAWVLHNINDFRYEDAEEPKILDNEVLVSVKAAGICGSDIPRVYENGAHKLPLILGHEFSGEVIKLGKDVKKTWLGKRVGIFPLIPCKECSVCRKFEYEMCRQYSYLGSRRDGGFAEYVAVPEWNLVEFPDAISYEEAAMLEPMAVAVHAMQRITFMQSQKVVVSGLGTIGLLLTMFLIEKFESIENGIQNIFVIGNKDFQKEMVTKIGLPDSHYYDGRKEDIKDWLMSHTDGQGADVFFECVGKNETVVQAMKLAAPGGEICMVGNPYTDMMLPKDIYWNILRRQLRITGTWNSSYKGREADDWRYVLQKLQQRKIVPTGLITHRLPVKDLEKGFHIMQNKTEDYNKIMMIR